MDETRLQKKTPAGSRRAHTAAALVATAAAAMIVASCAADEQSPLYVADDVGSDGGDSVGFTSEAGQDADVDADARVTPKMCVGTECPSPYATCGSTETLHCGTNLSNDANNCGACGNKCPTFDKFNATSRCVDGACELACSKRLSACGTEISYQDCNGFPDDGCEAVVSDDPNNCGTCGHVCPAGQACVKGSCGCPAGQTFCPGCSGTHFSQCVDLANDSYNCGGCNIVCPFVGACDIPPPNTQYGCANGECGALKCGTNTADCNRDLNLGCSSDGCEVDLTRDPNNCGACGNACGAGKECRDDGNGPECLATCETQGRTMCPAGCADLLSDPRNCGNCDYVCDTSGNQIAQCVKGICKPKCADGFADCDGNPSNGCEVNLTNNQTNCGACGAACDFVQGQPCIEGKCLMVECDAGITTK